MVEEISASPPTTFHSDASRSTITTEHLALVGFASRLGACASNDATDSKGTKSVRDEAKLLMSLLMGKKASEILSEEIGVTDDVDEDKKAARPKDRDMGNFAFTFPSLSLQPDASASATSGEKVGDSAHDDNEEEDDIPPPSELLGRTQFVNDLDAIRDSSEAMAHNVLESFGSALIWRAKTWINSLARVLALKVETDSGREGGEDLQLEGEGGAGNDDNEGEDISHSESSFDLMGSREMQIIESIVRSSEEVSVVNVKTSFHVTPNRIQDPKEPASKKLKTEISHNDDEYKVVHKLVFEAVVSMTSNEGDRYKNVKLQAPGLIEGAFLKSAGSGDGEEILNGVSITLDTHALALSLERQSRLVVRKAAEAALMAACGMEYTDTNRVRLSVISPRHDALMSPVPQNTYASDHETDNQRSLSISSVSIKSQSTGVVSSSEDGGCGSDSSAVTTSSLVPVKAPASAPHSPSFPALLQAAKAEFGGST